MARLEELSTKIKSYDSKKKEDVEKDYNPQIRAKLNDISKRGILKTAGFAAIGATGSALKTTTSWGARRILGDTIGGFVANKIDKIGTKKSGSEGIIRSVENLGKIFKAEIKDLATSQKTVGEKLYKQLKEKRENNTDALLSRYREKSYELTGKHPNDKALERLNEIADDSHTRVLSGGDAQEEGNAVKSAFKKQWIYDNPNESKMPSKLEKQLDILIKELVKELELEKEQLKNAELNKDNTKKLLERLVDSSGKSDEEVSIDNTLARNDTKHTPAAETKNTLIGMLEKAFPAILAGLTSLVGIFKGFPGSLVSLLTSGLAKLLTGLIKPFLSLLTKGAGIVKDVVKGAGGLLARVPRALGGIYSSGLMSAALDVGAGVAPLGVMYGVTKKIEDHSHDKERVSMFQGWGNSLNKMFNYDPEAKQKAWRIEQDRLLGVTPQAPMIQPKAISLPLSSKADKLEQVKAAVEQSKIKDATSNTKESPTIISNTTNNNTTVKDKVRLNPSRNSESSIQRMSDRAANNGVI